MNDVATVPVYNTIGQFVANPPAPLTRHAGYPDNVTVVCANGWSVSIGFGTSHYCSNRFQNPADWGTSHVVEVLVARPGGAVYVPETTGFDADGIGAWFPVSKLCGLIEYIAGI